MYLNIKIKSHHHKLNPEAFELFSKESSHLRISEVKPDSLILSVENRDNKTEPEFLAWAHEIFSYYLVAINIATLGHFSWDFQMVSPVPYFKSTKMGKFDDLLFLHRETNYKFNEDFLEINNDLVWRSIKIMIALGGERDQVFISEYIKGIYNLHNTFFNINFKNESFSSFYRVFEYFCTTKILNLKKLTNEKAQLKLVLSDFGFDKDVLEVFDSIYVVRCNEIMHAQKGLNTEVDMEVLVRLKIFLDSILHKYYEPKWKEGRVA